jgi:hypothetical protein
MFIAEMPEISSRDAAPDSAGTLLGINCRGSGRCSLTSGRNIFQLKAYIDQIGEPQSILQPQSH